METLRHFDQSASKVTTQATLAQKIAAKDERHTEQYAVLIKQINVACDKACQSIAPVWPLDRSIAVNPYWARVGMPIRKVAARMALLGSIQVFPTRVIQQQHWEQGRISEADLKIALNQVPLAAIVGLTSTQCVEELYSSSALEQLPLLIDVLDNDSKRHARLSWREAVTHQVSQTCAAYFDKHQADWQPERSQGLYTFWRETLQHDHGIGTLMGLPDLGCMLNALPSNRQEAENWVLQRLGLPQEVWADYLEAVLLTVNGWASWCAYLGWEARLQGSEDVHLRELLAIRLAWGAILLECKKDTAVDQAFIKLQHEWSQTATLMKKAEDALLVDEVWQVALEIGFQRQLAEQLIQSSNETTIPHKIEVQAAFCIDVRSELLRRALEDASPFIQTIGFAGFFGLPLAYTPLATEARRPQLPGLLAPVLEVADCIVPLFEADHQSDSSQNEAASRSRLANFALKNQWLSASRWPSAAFSFVEAAGFGYVAKLGQWLLPNKKSRMRDDLNGLRTRYRTICRPHIIGLDLNAKVLLAARVLHAMGLEQNLSPLVLLVGHGSQSANNAHAAALDCGACCGQTGEVNARTLAQLLNETAVRAALQTQGIYIPQSTWFVAALHNTTTDEIEGFDLDLLPTTTRTQWEGLQQIFLKASDKVRSERAPKLGLNSNSPKADLLNQLRRRANDGAQTRPEWGLAGNAAFLIAPRERSRGIAMQGRSFLHDYDANQDIDGSVLELLMTAPMLVTHWINWQYHASTCEPLRLGSGNKLLHNVVGGNIGVFEGNCGDLRIGLSHQSLHDGKAWVHEPLRLTVIIDAPHQAIEAVISKHEIIQQLLNNGWLHLWRYDKAQFLRYEMGNWQCLGLENFG